jgi:hypothetical protein
MKTFRIVFHGTNYDFRSEDGQQIGGFYVAVSVEADDPDQACTLAYEKLVCSDNYIAAFGRCQQPNGMLSVSECYELIVRESDEAEVSGFIFYPPEESARESLQ